MKSRCDEVRLWQMKSKTSFSVELNPPIAAATSSELARISSAQQIYSAVLADLIAFATGKCCHRILPGILLQYKLGYPGLPPVPPPFFSKKSAFILVTITASLDTAGYARRTVSATSYTALPHSHVHRSLANKCHVKRHFFHRFLPDLPHI